MDSVNQRHLQRMLQTIEATLAGEADLITAADSLHFLLANLEGVSRPWAEQVGSHILSLESLGLTSEQQKQTMGTSYGRVLEETLNSLDSLTNELLKEDCKDCS